MIATVLLALTSEPAPAEEPTALPTEAGAPEQTPEIDTFAEVVKRLEEVEGRLEELEHDNEQLRPAYAPEREPATDDLPLSAQFGGYIDVGFFWVGGDGAGTRPDIGNTRFPELDDVPGTWVFMGDPLSTMINSRGEAASLGSSQAIQFDAIAAGRNPSLIVNAVNFSTGIDLGKGVVVETLLDFMPRTRDVSERSDQFLGDFIDLKLAQLRWVVPVETFDFDLFVGKVDSVLGVEYQTQEAPYRLTVTPSLICRYTCGRSIGLASRMGFLNRMLQLNLAVTNGNNVSEAFGLHDEIDSNAFKSVSGRLAVQTPGPVGVQIGGSGMFGAQDLQAALDVYQWQYGVDARLRWRDLELVGEFVQIKANGETSAGGLACDLATCLDSRGVYGLLSYRALNWLVPYVRVDWRDAMHRRGDEFVYVTDGLRVGPGLNLPIGAHVVAKLEYNVNLELGRIPDFPNDVFTSSVIGYF